MTWGDQEVDEDEHKLIRVENQDGIKFYVVEAIPKKKDYIYRRKPSWVHAQDWTVPKIEFYDRKGQLLKIMRTEWMQVDGIWTWKRTVVENQQSGHRTEIDLSDVKMNQGLDDSRFTERSLRISKVQNWLQVEIEGELTQWESSQRSRVRWSIP